MDFFLQKNKSFMCSLCAQFSLSRSKLNWVKDLKTQLFKCFTVECEITYIFMQSSFWVIPKDFCMGMQKKLSLPSINYEAELCILIHPKGHTYLPKVRTVLIYQKARYIKVLRALDVLVISRWIFTEQRKQKCVPADEIKISYMHFFYMSHDS
jgi:hypothetical protein